MTQTDTLVIQQYNNDIQLAIINNRLWGCIRREREGVSNGPRKPRQGAGGSNGPPWTPRLFRIDVGTGSSYLQKLESVDSTYGSGCTVQTLGHRPPCTRSRVSRRPAGHVTRCAGRRCSRTEW